MNSTLVVCIREGNIHEVLEHLRSGLCHWAEVRADLFPPDKREQVVFSLCRDIQDAGGKVIFTARHVSEGGRMENAERIPLYLQCIKIVDAVDVEVSQQETLREVVDSARAAGKNVIFSYHNFTETPTPAELETVMEAVDRKKGEIFKVASMVKNREDALRLVRFTIAHASENVAVMGMGEKARWTRFVLPILGSRLAYASSGEGTAPGQPSLMEYIEAGRLLGIDWA